MDSGLAPNRRAPERRAGVPGVDKSLTPAALHSGMSNPRPSAAPEDRRRAPRADVDDPAYVSSHGSSTRCRLINISAEGAAIEVPDPAFIPNRFQLMTERDRVLRTCR